MNKDNKEDQQLINLMSRYYVKEGELSENFTDLVLQVVRPVPQTKRTIFYLIPIILFFIAIFAAIFMAMYPELIEIAMRKLMQLSPIIYAGLGALLYFHIARSILVLIFIWLRKTNFTERFNLLKQ